MKDLSGLRARVVVRMNCQEIVWQGLDSLVVHDGLTHHDFRLQQAKSGCIFRSLLPPAGKSSCRKLAAAEPFYPRADVEVASTQLSEALYRDMRIPTCLHPQSRLPEIPVTLESSGLILLREPCSPQRLGLGKNEAATEGDGAIADEHRLAGRIDLPRDAFVRLCVSQAGCP